MQTLQAEQVLSNEGSKPNKSKGLRPKSQGKGNTGNRRPQTDKGKHGMKGRLTRKVSPIRTGRRSQRSEKTHKTHQERTTK